MKEILDYKMVIAEIETDFFGNILTNQTKFNTQVMELIKQGYQPFGQYTSDSGSSGGWTSSSRPSHISQAMVKYKE